MRSVRGKLPWVAKWVLFTIFVCGSIFVTAGRAGAAPQPAGTVTISASIASVRYVLVNDQDVVVKVLSNCRQNVTPTVYRNNFTSAPIPLTPHIQRQYANIIKHADTSKYGVIYKAANGPDRRSPAVAVLLNTGRR